MSRPVSTVDTAFGRDDVSVLTASENHTARVRTFTSWLPLLSTIRVPCTEPCYAIIQSVRPSVCLSVPPFRSDPCESRTEVRRNFKTWQQCSPRAHVINDHIFGQKGHRSRTKVRSHEGTLNFPTGDKKCAAEMLKAGVLLKIPQSWLWESIVSLRPDSSNSQRAFTQFGKPKHAERMLGFSEVRKGALAIAIIRA